jgi:hypothetical protein
MDAYKEITARHDVAQQVQRALRSHKVNEENLGSTIDFLSNTLGGIIGALFPQETHEEKIKFCIEEIKHGIENGMPEE